jgi:hypothetical protein
MEDLSKLSLADLISTLKYLEDIEYDTNDFLNLVARASKENIEEEIQLFKEMLPRIAVDEEDFFSPDKIKEMESNLEIVTSKIFGIRKEIDEKLQLPTVDIRESLKDVSLFYKTQTAYNELKKRGEITKEMIKNSKSIKLPQSNFYNYNNKELEEKFPIWSRVVRYLIEEKGENLTSANYRSIQEYIRKPNIKI